MLHRFSGGGDDDCLEEDAPSQLAGSVVTTIALEEDAPSALADGGDDDYLEEDARKL